MYEHRYKHGKQKGIMPLTAFQAAMQDAINHNEPLDHLAYCTLLWHTGARKSEAYERVLADATVTKNLVIVDFHKRKKGGEEVPALKIPRSFYGVNEFLAPWIQERAVAKPSHKFSRKRLYFQVETGEYRQTKPTPQHPEGMRVTVKKRASRIERAWWLFPRIDSTSAWYIVKRILGDKFYPHYLRLRKLSAIGKNPETRSLIHIKSVSGLKSVRAIEAYLGYDEETQDEAMSQNE